MEKIQKSSPKSEELFSVFLPRVQRHEKRMPSKRVRSFGPGLREQQEELFLTLQSLPDRPSL